MFFLCFYFFFIFTFSFLHFRFLHFHFYIFIFTFLMFTFLMFTFLIFTFSIFTFSFFFHIIYLLLLPLTFLPHNSPLINIDMMVGVDVSNPAKLSVFLSFGSAIVKQLLVIPTTMSLASIPMTARYCSSAT